jgi:hypothetical protein
MKLWVSVVCAFILSAASSARPLFLAHVMPWYQSPPVSSAWGWHWTMNKFDPATGKGASRFHPVIGFYDSADPDVIEYQLLTMKTAGIDGVLVDWYGDQDAFDYLSNHKATLKILEGCEKYGMKFALVYEDQTVPNLIKAGTIKSAETQSELGKLMGRLENGMFKSAAYLREDGHPLFLVFGPQFYHDDEFPKAFRGLRTSPSYYSLMDRRPGAVGGYAWPVPQKGLESSWDEIEAFCKRATKWTHSIPVVYPRFLDVYTEAGVQPGFPEIPDDKGETLSRMLRLALAQNPSYIQICTWNDWGEGTQIEPSVELGLSALVKIQSVTGVARSTDLDLPLRLYRLRKSHLSASKLDPVAQAIAGRRFAEAKRSLDKIKRETQART